MTPLCRHEGFREEAVAAKPITTGRRDAEDFRSGPIVRHRFLLDRIDVPGDHPSVHVEPEFAFVHAADAAQAHLALADLAVPGAGDRKSTRLNSGHGYSRY